MSAMSNVSRETQLRLERYAETLRKWNPKINLVSKSTLDDLWERHFEDSLQLVSHIKPDTGHLVDMGSGGGFPGLVVGLVAAETGNPSRTTLIESDQRKSAFLRTVLRETESKATILTERIEEAPPQNAEVLTARALADLSKLLSFSERHLAANGTALFLKGKNWREEIKTAQETWHFQWNAVESKTNPEAVLLEIGEISRV